MRKDFRARAQPLLSLLHALLLRANPSPPTPTMCCWHILSYAKTQCLIETLARSGPGKELFWTVWWLAPAKLPRCGGSWAYHCLSQSCADHCMLSLSVHPVSAPWSLAPAPIAVSLVFSSVSYVGFPRLLTMLLFICQSWNNFSPSWLKSFTEASLLQLSPQWRIRTTGRISWATHTKLPQKPKVLSGIHYRVCSMRKPVLNITTNCCLMSKTSFGRKDSSTNFIGINTEGVGSLAVERARKGG